MPEEYAKFSDEAVQQALSSAASSEAIFEQRSLNGDPVNDVSFSIRAECINVTVTDRGVCVGLPLGLGNVCIPLPIGIDIGTVARACIDIYYKSVLGIKIPAGVEVSVYVGDQKVASARFGL